MEAKELMIGNYIYKLGKNIITVESETFRNVESMMFPYKPIELTEEWLEKFGFKIREVTVNGKNYKHYSDFKSIAIEMLSSDFFILCQHKGYEHIQSIIRVETVHQLQNLYFALTGEELILKQ